MMDLTTYTTSELERLSALNYKAAKPGEFVINAHADVFFRTNVAEGLGALVDATGRQFNEGRLSARVRRVRSFTNLTEVDPPVADMQRELERRKAMDAAAAPYTMGDTVRWHGNTYRVTGIRSAGTDGAKLTLTRTAGWLDVHVDPREVTKVEPPTPHPVISNATHAGRRVQHSTLGDGRVVDSKNAARWIKGLGITYEGVVVVFDNGSMDGFSPKRFTLLD